MFANLFSRRIIFIILIVFLVNIFLVSIKISYAQPLLNGSTGLTAQSCNNCQTEQCRQYCGDYQLNDGLAHLVGDRESGTLLSLSIDHPKNQYYSQLLNYLTPHLHEAMQRINGRDVKQESPPLTAREREVLKWIGEGKSSWEIGVILSISERTVKYHINNVKSKLNAVNRPHAVAKALRFRIIS